VLPPAAVYRRTLWLLAILRNARPASCALLPSDASATASRESTADQTRRPETLPAEQRSRMLGPRTTDLSCPAPLSGFAWYGAVIRASQPYRAGWVGLAKPLADDASLAQPDKCLVFVSRQSVDPDEEALRATKDPGARTSARLAPAQHLGSMMLGPVWIGRE